MSVRAVVAISCKAALASLLVKVSYRVALLSGSVEWMHGFAGVLLKAAIGLELKNASNMAPIWYSTLRIAPVDGHVQSHIFTDLSRFPDDSNQAAPTFLASTFTLLIPSNGPSS